MLSQTEGDLPEGQPRWDQEDSDRLPLQSQPPASRAGRLPSGWPSLTVACSGPLTVVSWRAGWGFPAGSPAVHVSCRPFSRDCKPGGRRTFNFFLVHFIFNSSL